MHGTEAATAGVVAGWMVASPAALVSNLMKERSEMLAVIPWPIVHKKLCPLGNVTERGDLDPAWHIKWLVCFQRRMHLSISI